MPETDLPVVRYQSEEAAELADLISIRMDLLQANQICERLFHELRASAQDAVLIDALWTAALIRYARCFATGKRKPLDLALIANLPGDPLGAHNYYKNQRDKLAAHSVNPFEEAQVGLALSAPTEENRQVVGIVEFVGRLVSSDEAGVKQLGALARELRQRVEEQIAVVKERVLARAKTEPIDALYRLETLTYTAPSPEMAGHARRR
jgi:hypothetical protein